MKTPKGPAAKEPAMRCACGNPVLCLIARAPFLTEIDLELILNAWVYRKAAPVVVKG
jgi:hypothetical protein